MGDELLNMHLTLVDRGSWQKVSLGAAGDSNGGGGGDASPHSDSLPSSNDLNVIVSSLRLAGFELGFC